MTRNISDECKQYDDQFKGYNDAFDISDYIQVKDMVMDAMNGSRSINLFLYTATDTALKAGFMIGYKAGTRAARKDKHQSGGNGKRSENQNKHCVSPM